MTASILEDDPLETECASMTSAVIDCRALGISDWQIILALLATAGSVAKASGDLEFWKLGFQAHADSLAELHHGD